MARFPFEFMQSFLEELNEQFVAVGSGCYM